MAKSKLSDKGSKYKQKLQLRRKFARENGYKTTGFGKEGNLPMPWPLMAELGES